MISSRKERSFWVTLLVVVIAAGLGSRRVHTGSLWIDKYAGDALYAAMVYALLHLSGRCTRVAFWASAVLLAIECFQLTGVPASLAQHPQLAVRLLARLLGTEFSWLDLLAYAVGIAAMALLDRTRYQKSFKPS